MLQIWVLCSSCLCLKKEKKRKKEAGKGGFLKHGLIGLDPLQEQKISLLIHFALQTLHSSAMGFPCTKPQYEVSTSSVYKTET